MKAATATADPPFSETLLSAGRPLARRLSLASAAPTNPTGTPMTRAGSTSLVMISASAVGAQPTSQTAPGPASPCASRTAAALSVMFAVRASRALSESPILQITGYPVMPEATMATSAMTGASRRSASTPAASAISSQTRSVT